MTVMVIFAVIGSLRNETKMEAVPMLEEAVVMITGRAPCVFSDNRPAVLYLVVLNTVL